VGHGHPTLHLNLGILALREGQLDEAQQEAERSFELAPTTDALVLLGRIHLRGERPAEARAVLERALALDPRHVRALSHLAVASLRLGDLDGAERALARAVETAPDREDLRRRLKQLRQRKLEAAN
jgi:Flp pilus assembly protein TadD